MNKIKSIYSHFIKANLKQKILFLLSWTLFIASYLKSKIKDNDNSKDLKRDLINKLNISYLVITSILIFIIYFFYQNWLLIIFAIYSFFRVNEIFIAFIKDSTSHLEKNEHSSSLKYYERIPLALKSYLELILLYGIIHLALYNILGGTLSCSCEECTIDILNTIYYSGVTITTLGYGEIIPTAFTSKFLVIYEVLNGFTLLIVSFTIYVSKSLSNNEAK